MDTMRAERVSPLLARQLAQSVAVTNCGQSTEEQIPASRVLKVEELEPLGLAVRCCLFLRALQVDQIGVDRMLMVG